MTDDKTAPYVENYPVLEEWLTRQRAKYAWSISMPSRSMVSMYVVNDRTFLITVEPDQRGWEVYTALDSIHVMETLVDAEERLGLKIGVH